ncbi:hypothetical protein [Alcaligenes aquatilis]|uniref:hypothetical protein n=1 Tax=Alcaligenes aquatilis TaxID=323284 RepID=UPI003F8ED318
MSTPSFFITYGPLLAAATVSIGWFISNKQANTREKRKEVRDDIKEIEKKLSEILSISRKTIDHFTEEEDRKISIYDLNRALLDLDLQKDHIYARKLKNKSIVHRNRIDSVHEKFYDLISGDFLNQDNSTAVEKQDFIFETHRESTLIIHNLKSLFLSEFD